MQGISFVMKFRGKIPILGPSTYGNCPIFLLQFQDPVQVLRGNLVHGTVRDVVETVFGPQGFLGAQLLH